MPKLRSNLLFLWRPTLDRKFLENNHTFCAFNPVGFERYWYWYHSIVHFFRRNIIIIAKLGTTFGLLSHNSRAGGCKVCLLRIMCWLNIMAFFPFSFSTEILFSVSCYFQCNIWRTRYTYLKPYLHFQSPIIALNECEFFFTSMSYCNLRLHIDLSSESALCQKGFVLQTSTDTHENKYIIYSKSFCR